MLAEHFARAMTRDLGRGSFAGFTAAALERLSAYSWPGNVRELKNVVERSLHRWPKPEEPVDDIVFDAFAPPHRPRAAPLSILGVRVGRGRAGQFVWCWAGARDDTICIS